MHVCQIQNWKHPNATALYKISVSCWQLYASINTNYIYNYFEDKMDNQQFQSVQNILNKQALMNHIFHYNTCILCYIMTYNDLRKKNKVMEQWCQSPMAEGVYEDIIWITTLVRMVLIHHVHPRMLYFSLKQSF